MSSNPANRQKKKNYTEEEDFVLAKSWKVISEDPIKGTDQSSNDFWNNIRAHASLSLPSFENRFQDSLRQRFGTIGRIIAKFSGCYVSVMRLNQSGKSNEDKFEDAVSLFKEENKGTNFKYRAIWEVLKDTPKFSPGLTKKRSLADLQEFEEEHLDAETDSFSQSSTSNRPMGQKAAKKLKLSQDLEERRTSSLEKIAEASTKRNSLLETHSKVLSDANDVNFLNFVTMDTSQLDPVAREIVEIKKRQYLQSLKELDQSNNTEEDEN